MFQKKEERFLNIKGALYNNIGGITKFVWKKPNGTPVEGYSANLYSYEFDGVNEYIDFKDPVQFSSDYTISVWFKTSVGGSNNYILGGQSGWSLNMNFGDLQVVSSDNSFDMTGLTGYNDGEWHQAVYTYNRTSGAFKCYVDTVLVKSQTATTGVDSPKFFKIGSNFAGSVFYQGRIDEFIMFGSELNATDVTALYNNGFVSNPASLSPSNQVRLGDGDVLVKGLDFDGVAEYVTLGNVLNLFPSDSFSLSFWFNKDTATGHTIIGNRGAAGYGWQMRINANVLYFQFITSGGVFYFRGGTVSTSGTWNHALITYDGSGSSAGGNIYLNGVDDLSAASGTGSGTWAAKELTIGATAGTAPRLNGKLFTVAYFDSVLTSGNAVTLYNGGIPKLATALGLSPNNEWDLAKRFTKSLTFDGVNELISFGNVLNLEYTDAFTFSGWIKPTISGVTCILSRQGGSPSLGYMVYITGSRLTLSLGDGTNVPFVQSSVLSSGQLYNFTITYDGTGDVSGMNMYIDGVLDNAVTNSDPISSTITNSNNFQIGRRDTSQYYYAGEILNISYFNTELTSGNAFTLYNAGVPNTATNLGLTPTNEWDIYNEDVNYFDGTNHVIVDQAGSINGASVNMELVDITDVFWAVTDEAGSLNGTSVNMEEADEVAVGWIADDITGDVKGLSVNMEETDRKLGVAYSADFNGTDEYINFGNVLDIDGATPFSISLWLNADVGFPSFANIISKFDIPNSKGFLFRQTGSSLDFFLKDDLGGRLSVESSAGAITANTWHHIVCTYDGSKTPAGIKIYRDKSLLSTSTGNDAFTTSSSNTADFLVGVQAGLSNYWNGSMTRLQYHNKALNQLEVNTLYGNGVPVTAAQGGLSDSATLDTVLFGENDTATTITDNSSSGFNGTLVNMDLTNKSNDTP